MRQRGGKGKNPFLWLPNMQCTDYFEQKLLASSTLFATKQSVVVSKSTPLEKYYYKRRVARGKKLPKMLFLKPRSNHAHKLELNVDIYSVY